MPPAPAVPTPPAATVASSAFASTSIQNVCPAAKLKTEPTLMFVSPLAAAAARIVGLGEPGGVVRKMTELLFSRTVFATPTLPTSQPARVYGTQGAGALRTAPVPPSEAGSLLTMLKFESADAVGGVLAGLPPSVLSVQYLNVDENRRRAVSPEVAVRVRDRLTVPVGIEPGQRAQDPATGVRDEHRVIIRQQRAVVLDEIEQVRHLLEIGRHVRVVTQEVSVVELDVDDVLDRTLGRLELATGRRGRCPDHLHRGRHGQGRGRKDRCDRPAMRPLIFRAGEVEPCGSIPSPLLRAPQRHHHLGRPCRQSPRRTGSGPHEATVQGRR